MPSRCGASTLSVALAVLACSLVPERAQAAEPDTLPIELELTGCEALDPSALEKLLTLEFRTLNVAPTTPRERVQVECGADHAIVRLESGSASNEVDFAATAAPARPRLLALAVSELVTESRARVQAKSAPRAVPRAAAPAPASPEPTRMSRKNSGLRVFAGAALRRALRPATWLSGPDLGVTLELNRHFSVAGDLRLELGHTSTALARVDWLSTSGALAVLVGGSVARLSVGVGPGMCAGYLHLSPRVLVASATGHTVSGVWAGPELLARARYELGTSGFIVGGVDLGIVTSPVTGLVNDEQRLVDTGGTWLSALVGAGLLF